MEPLDHVIQWLNKLELEEPPRHEDSNPQPQVPHTPNIRPNLALADDEVSPTNTNFSSIFDSPIENVRRKKIHSHASTLASSIGSDSDEDNWAERCEAKSAEVAPCDPFLVVDEVTSQSIAPSSAADRISGQYINEACVQLKLTAEPVTLGTTRQVFITSCYQCILAGLPCSRALPGCSRCKRAGCQHLCLLHRRKLLGEMVLGDVVGNRTPVLLRLRGDDEVTWENKLVLLHEVSGNPLRPSRSELTVCYKLQKVWKSRKERENWILPAWDGPRGTYGPPHRYRDDNLHPGEGLGRTTFREVELG